MSVSDVDNKKRRLPRDDAADPADPFVKLSPRTARLLRGQGLTTALQVTARYPEALLAIRGFGFKSLREVEHCFLTGQHYQPRNGRHSGGD